jgi:hypothetical protein
MFFNYFNYLPSFKTQEMKQERPGLQLVFFFFFQFVSFFLFGSARGRTQDWSQLGVSLGTRGLPDQWPHQDSLEGQAGASTAHPAS